jgi:hypothetical protein
MINSEKMQMMKVGTARKEKKENNAATGLSVRY